MNKLEIIKHVTGEHSFPYRIIEIYPCLDGYRTRVTKNCFATQREAIAFIKDVTPAS